MPSKEEVQNNVFEHSQAKLDFYKNYLWQYLTVLVNDTYTDIINIYDVFCGVGIYDDGKSGSPIIAIDIIKSVLEKHKNKKKITLTINDFDISKVKNVALHINKNFSNICEFTQYNLDAEKMFEQLKLILGSQPKKVKNLIFIDPYGYKEIFKKDILDIMSLGSNEIIIFLPIAQMYRFSNVAFTNEENNSYNHLRRFIQDFFQEEHPIFNENLNSQQEYIGYIKNAMSCEKYLSASYSIQRDNRNYYALFFITKHIYGLHKIIDTKWKLDNNCGEGFKQEGEINLFSEVFEDEKKENCIKYFEKLLIEFIQKPKNNLEIYEFTLKEGFLPKHAKDILIKLNNKQRLASIQTLKYFYLSWDNYKKDDVRYVLKYQ